MFLLFLSFKKIQHCKDCHSISIISSSDICSSTDCREEAPPPTAIFFSSSIEVMNT